MSVEWFCRLMGTEMGPYTSSQLIEMARSHRLTPDDSVRKGAEGNWVDAHRVKGLFEDAASSTIILRNLPSEMTKAAPTRQDQAKDSPASEPRPVSWHYISDHNKIGPLSFADLVAHGEQGILKPTDRVWSSSSPKWCEAKQVKGLTFGRPADQGDS